MLLIIGNHRQIQSIDSMKINQQCNYKRFFLLAICHSHRWYYQQNYTGKFFLFGVLLLSVNSLVILLPTD